MPRLSRRWFLLRRGQAQWTVPSRILPLLPALRTLSSEKMGDSRRFFVFKMLTRTRRTITRSREFFFLAACFLQVYARKRGNRPFFALLPPSSLIPCTLTYVNRKLLCSSRLGVTCHPPPDAVGGALFDSPPNPSSSGPQPRPWDTDCTPDSAPHPAANRVGIRARIGGCYTPESGTDRQRKTALTVKNRVPESVPISGRPQPETQNKTSCNHEQKNWPVKREDQKQSQAN